MPLTPMALQYVQCPVFSHGFLEAQNQDFKPFPDRPSLLKVPRLWTCMTKLGNDEDTSCHNRCVGHEFSSSICSCNVKATHLFESFLCGRQSDSFRQQWGHPVFPIASSSQLIIDMDTHHLQNIFQRNHRLSIFLMSLP